MNIMHTMKTQAGYQISTAESADEAENWLAEGHHRPQLVILDVQMLARRSANTVIKPAHSVVQQATFET